MLKGVNRQVVEVAETGSDYFERAIFFVNPKYYGITDGKLREKAQSLMTAADAPPKTREINKKSWIKTLVAIAGSAIAGSIITLISTSLF